MSSTQKPECFANCVSIELRPRRGDQDVTHTLNHAMAGGKRKSTPTLRLELYHGLRLRT
jgi:hypothetical protein